MNWNHVENAVAGPYLLSLVLLVAGTQVSRSAILVQIENCGYLVIFISSLIFEFEFIKPFVL